MDFDGSNLWEGTGCDGEGVFGAAGVIFLVGDLVCAGMWC